MLTTKQTMMVHVEMANNSNNQQTMIVHVEMANNANNQTNHDGACIGG